MLNKKFWSTMLKLSCKIPMSNLVWVQLMIKYCWQIMTKDCKDQFTFHFIQGYQLNYLPLHLLFLILAGTVIFLFTNSLTSLDFPWSNFDPTEIQERKKQSRYIKLSGLEETHECTIGGFFWHISWSWVLRGSDFSLYFWSTIWSRWF